MLLIVIKADVFFNPYFPLTFPKMKTIKYSCYLCPQIKIYLMSSMKKLQKFFKSPYPVFYQRWKIALISCIIVFLILALLQPFGISNISHNKLGVLLGYMMVTGVFLSIPVYLFPFLFPEFYKDDNWTVGKYLLNNLLIFFFIAVGNWLYSDILFGWGLHWEIFLSFLFATVIIGLFPSVFFVMLNRNRLLASHLREAVEMNRHLQKVAAVSSESEKAGEEDVIIFSGGTKESLEMAVKDLLYIETEGNYVKITYRKNDKPVQKLLRATMKQIEEVAKPFPYLAKCHRAFLVNLYAVSKVSGNSQGYHLSLYDSEVDIPVSRAYSKDIRMLIESMNNG